MIFRLFSFFLIVSYVTVPAFSLPFASGDPNRYYEDFTGLKGRDGLFACNALNPFTTAEREAYNEKLKEEQDKKNNAHITNDNSNGSHDSAGIQTYKGDDTYGYGPGGRVPSPGSQDGTLDEKTDAIVVRDDSVYPPNSATKQNQPGPFEQPRDNGENSILSISKYRID